MTIQIKDLNPNQQRILVRWAHSHDWGQMATITQTGNLGSLIDESVLNGVLTSHWAFVTTIDELGDFAGYTPDELLDALEELE